MPEDSRRLVPFMLQIEEPLQRIYTILLSSLLITLILSPLISVLGGSGDFVELLLFANLAMAAIGTSAGKYRNSLVLTLACAGGLRLAGRFSNLERVSDVATLLWITMAAIAAVRAFRYALGGLDVNSEHICAALSVYMLAGLFFGLAYWKIEQTWPGSFALGGNRFGTGQFDLPTGIYFSFVTLATVGFGDIVPVNPVTRGLVVTEAVLGQFFMVVLVARLVSMYTQRRQIGQEQTQR
jgi:hypothetical protein